MNRYSRQIILPEVGEEGQKRLSDAHALVIGAGGLGAPVIQYLAGAGVGSMTIVDDDLVDETNLHRQTLFTMDDIGQEKAEAAAQFARRLNPEISVYPIAQGLDPANAEMMVKGANIVLDCADSFAVSYTLSDTCLRLRKPLISASALQMSGYVGGFCGGAPSLRAVFPDMPNNVQNCADGRCSWPCGRCGWRVTGANGDQRIIGPRAFTIGPARHIRRPDLHIRRLSL